MPDPLPVEQSTDAENWASFLEAVWPFTETCAGYKARLTKLGFSASTAEAMALDVHHYLIAMLTAQSVPLASTIGNTPAPTNRGD